MSDALRMLVVAVDTYPPTRVDVSVLFGEELATRGHRIDWILQSEEKCDASYVASWGGGKVWVGATDLGASLFSRIRKHALGIWNDLRLIPMMRGPEYDLIEVKDKFISGIFAAIAARLFRKRFVYWLSYPFPEEYLLRARDGTGRYPMLYLIRGTVFGWLLYGLLLRAADHVFVQSEQMRQDLARRGVPLARMTAVPMGIRLRDTLQNRDDSTRRFIPAGEPAIVYLGSLAKLRHLELLIAALAMVRQDVPQARLYLVGRGDFPDDEQMLMDEARRLDVQEGLVLVGQKPQSEAFQYVLDADVCVSPIYPTPVFNCASPTKLVEYMALGKTVVANDHPEQRFLLEQSGGGYSVPWNPRSFADAIVKLLKAGPAERREMGARGRSYVTAHRTYGVIADVVESGLLRVARGELASGHG